MKSTGVNFVLVITILWINKSNSKPLNTRNYIQIDPNYDVLDDNAGQLAVRNDHVELSNETLVDNILRIWRIPNIKWKPKPPKIKPPKTKKKSPPKTKKTNRTKRPQITKKANPTKKKKTNPTKTKKTNPTKRPQTTKKSPKGKKRPNVDADVNISVEINSGHESDGIEDDHVSVENVKMMQMIIAQAMKLWNLVYRFSHKNMYNQS